MLKSLIGKTIALKMNGTDDIDIAIKTSLDKMTSRVGGDGGAVAVRADGAFGVAFNSYRMAWAYARGDRLHSGCSKGDHFTEDI